MDRLLNNRNVLITGVRNKWSIAWGIAEAVDKAGGNIILAVQSEREAAEIRKLSEILGSPCSTFVCDITSDTDIGKLFEQVRDKYGELHGLVHAIAHAKAEDLKGEFINTSRDGFAHALEISAFSLIALSAEARKIMPEGGSVLTLTYMGSEKVFRDYKIMGVAKAALETSVYYLASDLGRDGIRINAISAGPVKTMAAKGISNFNTILDTVRERAPLGRNVTREDIGNSSVYLLSDLSSGVTGEILHVDCGFNKIGM